jgi:hypothetical protein
MSPIFFGKTSFQDLRGLLLKKIGPADHDPPSDGWRCFWMTPTIVKITTTRNYLLHRTSIEHRNKKEDELSSTPSSIEIKEKTNHFFAPHHSIKLLIVNS